MSYVTEVKLLSVPLESDYKHTLYFTNSASQKAYFDSKAKHTFTELAFQQTNGIMRVGISYDTAILCNYVMYKNKNKWYYAFITDYQYYGDDQTNLTIETDVLQTWMFDYTVLPSFIDREHVSDDTIGLHTYPEGVEMGEYVVNYKYVHEPFTDLKVVVGVTETSLGTLGDMSRMYNGVYSGLIYYAFDNTATGHKTVQSFIQAYAESSKSSIDAIQCMFLAPREMCWTAHDSNANREDYYVDPSDTTSLGTFSIQRELMLIDKSYKPKNNKLYCYPYKYMLVSNNNGGSAIYQIEHFRKNTQNTIDFRLDGCLSPGCSIRAVPVGYKGTEAFEGFTHNDEEGINMGKYPILNWTSDVYTNWLTQNAVNIGLNLASGLGQAIAGGVTMYGSAGLTGGGDLMGGLSTIASQLGQMHQMSMTPPQANGNTNSGDVVTASGKNSLFFYGMSIKDEYIRIIDEFFSMYGYKCNRVKTPNKGHRPGFWYTKTIDVNISGTVPQSDLQIIKNCYNSGITFWVDPNNIKNYNTYNQLP